MLLKFSILTSETNPDKPCASFVLLCKTTKTVSLLEVCFKFVKNAHTALSAFFCF